MDINGAKRQLKQQFGKSPWIQSIGSSRSDTTNEEVRVYLREGTPSDFVAIIPRVIGRFKVRLLQIEEPAAFR